ncbi:MAG: methylmalonyl-CoA mutase family protein [Conexivisphaerales archaeon]
MKAVSESTFWEARLRRLKEKKRRTDPKLEERLEDWYKKVYLASLKKLPERKKEFLTPSNIRLKAIYTPADIEDIDPLVDIGLPGEYPYTRGIHPTMYRSRLWTMRMFSGFGAPEDTNKRLKYLLNHGETGLSIAFDMPTLYGYDADDPRAFGEVGRCGVNVSSLDDMLRIFHGIPLDKVSTSMTINAPAAVLMAMYVAVAEKQGVQKKLLRGTVQTDILKEYIAQKEWAFPPEAHMRIIRDMMVYSTREMPQWNYISISGYHIREAGANAIQELAFTLADGFAYVDLGISAGLPVDSFAPRLSFFFNCTMNFFEEIAKFRAARRIWATVMKEKYHAKDPRSLLLRFHTQTSGASLTWQQPLNNIVRTAIEALAAVLGGTQSLHTNSYDEAWALPTEKAAMIALRTQQIIAEETGVADVVDPLGGSYYLEWLTRKLEEGAYEYFDKIEKAGGVLQAIKSGFLQREIAETAYQAQKKVENGENTIVGVNAYKIRERKPIDILRIDERAQRLQIRRVKRLKETRDNKKVSEVLESLKQAFSDDTKNVMYTIIDAVKAKATLGEIMNVGREVYGGWSEPSLL